jgi:hypothetical protein
MNSNNEKSQYNIINKSNDNGNNLRPLNQKKEKRSKVAVKLFEEYNLEELERVINEFISSNYIKVISVSITNTKRDMRVACITYIKRED